MNVYSITPVVCIQIYSHLVHTATKIGRNKGPGKQAPMGSGALLQKKMDRMLRMSLGDPMSLAQNANGSFPVTEDVTRIMNLDLTKTLEYGKPLDPRAWVTLVCIAYLKTFCQEDKVIWEPVVTKGEKWLKSSFPDVGEDSLQKAVEFLHLAYTKAIALY